MRLLVLGAELSQAPDSGGHWLPGAILRSNIKLVSIDGVGSCEKLTITMDIVAQGIVVQFRTLDIRGNRCLLRQC